MEKNQGAFSKIKGAPLIIVLFLLDDWLKLYWDGAKSERMG